MSACVLICDSNQQECFMKKFKNVLGALFVVVSLAVIGLTLGGCGSYGPIWTEERAERYQTHTCRTESYNLNLRASGYSGNRYSSSNPYWRNRR